MWDAAGASALLQLLGSWLTNIYLAILPYWDVVAAAHREYRKLSVRVLLKQANCPSYAGSESKDAGMRKQE
jgi:hypothetical protein